MLIYRQICNDNEIIDRQLFIKKILKYQIKPFFYSISEF